MKLRLRAKLAVALINAGHRLLAMPRTASEDLDTCVFCKAKDREDGTAEHKADCPSITGVYVVTLQDMWPGGPPICDHCDTTLWPGDRYSYIDCGDPFIREFACTGCSVLAELEAAA